MDHEPCLPKKQWHENFRCTYPSQRHWSNIPAIPSLTSTSKKNQHSNFWDHQLTAVQCCSFSCICSGGQLCYPGLPGTLQPISWDPSGMFLSAETLGSFTKVFSDKTIQDTTEYFRLEGTLKTIMFHPPKRRGISTRQIWFFGGTYENRVRSCFHIEFCFWQYSNHNLLPTLSLSFVSTQKELHLNHSKK